MQRAPLAYRHTVLLLINSDDLCFCRRQFISQFPYEGCLVRKDLLPATMRQLAATSGDFSAVRQMTAAMCFVVLNSSFKIYEISVSLMALEYTGTVPAGGCHQLRVEGPEHSKACS